MAFEPHVQKVVDQLWPDGKESHIYAILDTARDEVIYGKILASDIEYVCLYPKDEAKRLEDVAPYLVKLEKDDSFTEWVLNNGWGNSWGIFLESLASMDELRWHFQKFIRVCDEDGNVMLFRFYDPRVLQTYIPTCNESERLLIFGPIIQFQIEDAEGKPKNISQTES